jgi:hypothetical protein
MFERIRPVAFGLFLGLLSLIFGVLWAMDLVAGHDSIHKTLEEAEKRAQKPAAATVINESAAHGHGAVEAKAAEGKGEHASELMEEAHERLTRGHLHSMGLGLVAIAASFILAFVDVPSLLKTLGSISLGLGCFLYPFSWIIMGYRTPSLGIEGAHMSVFLFAGVNVVLVIIGLFITLISLVAGFFKRD